MKNLILKWLYQYFTTKKFVKNWIGVIDNELVDLRKQLTISNENYMTCDIEIRNLKNEVRNLKNFIKDSDQNSLLHQMETEEKELL